MKAQYKVVHFRPHPIVGPEFPVAAVLRSGRDIAVIPAPHLPSPACLGGRAAAEVLEATLRYLAEAPQMDALSTSIGPHASLDELREVPRGVEDPASWVKRFVLPQGTKAVSGGSIRPPNRTAQGQRFLEAHHVDRYVRRSLTPRRDLSRWRRLADRTLPSISQWVPGTERLLLLEPVVPAQARRLKQAIQDINGRFSTYERALSQEPNLAADTIAYLLPGGSERERAGARNDLQLTARVLDVALPPERDALLSLVEERGREAARQGLLELTEH